MTAYYLQELPEEVQEFLVADTDDPMICPQDAYPEDNEVVKQILNTMCINGQIVVFYTGKIAVTLTRKTEFVGNVDTKVGKDSTARDVIRGYKEFINWAQTGTFYYKLESRTPLEKYAKIMAKSVPNTKIEGVCEKSYMTKEGKLMDEYMVGFVLDRGLSCQS